jgi:aryl carrier-like protein
MQSTLGRIWSQCLGVETVAPGDNFFELGGDSLVAIGVAMTASHEGVELTPQDLYDNATLGALADTLVARYAFGGLSSQDAGDLNPAVPRQRPVAARALAGAAGATAGLQRECAGRHRRPDGDHQSP